MSTTDPPDLDALIIPEGIESSIQITSNEEQVQQQTEEQEANGEEVETDEGLSLGDHIQVNSDKYGTIEGTIYYLNESLMSVLPTGISNGVIDLPIIDGTFDPDLGITSDIELLEKGPGPSSGFIAWQGYYVGQELISYLADGSKGPTYTITLIQSDKDSDRMKVRDLSDKEETIDFNFIGIPQDLGIKTFVIKSQVEKEPVLTPEQVDQLEQDRADAQTPGVVEAKALGIDIELEEEDIIENIEDPIPDSYKVEEQFVELEELSKQERIYPELLQKNELLSDLISLESTPLLQLKSTSALRNIRSFVELFSSLKNSIIQRSYDGVPSGELPITLTTFADLLKHASIPIAKPVLTTKRILVAEATPYGTQSETSDIIVMNLKSLLDNSNDFLETQGSIPKGEAGIGIPRWYQTLYGYFQQFPIGDQYTSGGGYTFLEDGEYFRNAIPFDPSLQGLVILGTSKARNEQYSEKPEQFISKILLAFRRGHGPTFRSLEKGGTEILFPGDEASLLGHVVFPYKAVLTGAIGAIRTGSLWSTMLRSMVEYKYHLLKLFDKFGLVQTSIEKDAQKIFYVSNTDSSVASISFADYLTLILKTLVPFGNGDLHAMKGDLGIQSYEFTIEQQESIQLRIKEVISSLRALVRKSMEAPYPEAAKPNSLFEGTEFIGYIEQVIKARPLLETLRKELAIRTPGYTSIDIGILGYLLHYAQDYTLTAFGGNQQGSELAESQLIRMYKQIKLQHSIQFAQLQASAGQPPQPNPCEHVAKLELIRKVANEKERMGLLVKFANEYSNDRVDNWITCAVCNQHLICHHEVLQIQQYLYPNERDVLQKQIVLHYAGGLFGKNYICRNCGLPILELEFDTSVEFDDQGRPMMGRSVLVDLEQENNEELNLLFSIQSKDSETDISSLVFESESKNEYYGIVRILSDALGVALDVSGYRSIVEQANIEFTANTISDVEYNKRRDALKDKKMIEYRTYLSRKKIGFISALLLLEIQTHMPDYVVQFYVKDCSKPGFGGFPLKQNSSSKSPDDTIGLQYISCVLSGIVRSESPWKFGFQTISKLEVRKNEILSKLTIYMEQLCKQESIQNTLQKKRSYLDKIEGYSSVKDRILERLPFNFLPRIESSGAAKANAAAAPSIKEGSHGSFGQILQADTWIRAMNEKAKQMTLVVRGNPFAEQACCFTSILQPGAFLRGIDLPPMPNRIGLQQSFERRSILYTPMISRSLQPFNATPALTSAYRVFLQLCWKGPRAGLPHEIGYDTKCDWCNISIPTNYLYPDMDKNGAPILNEQELRSQFDLQGVPITDTSFQQLLDNAHNQMQFTSYRYTIPEDPLTLLTNLGTLKNPPVVEWSKKLEEAKTMLASLTDGTSGADIVHALHPLSDSIEQGESRCIELLGQANYAILKSILKLQPSSFFEVLRSYFLVPAQRLLSMYESKLYLRVQKYYKLSEEHTKVLNSVIDTHTNYLENNILFDETGTPNPKLKRARLKLKQFVKTCSDFLKQATELRLSRIQYDKKIPMKSLELFLQELLHIFLIGPLGDLVRPEVLSGKSTYSEESDTFLLQFINRILLNYKQEYLSYDPVAVRQKLEASKEREKQRFIGELDAKGEEERRVELLKKQLGIGRWAIGGTKLVYSYDPDQWDKNRMEMELDYATAAGLVADTGRNVGPIPGQMLDDGLERANYEEADRGYGDEGMDFGAYGDDE